MRRNKLGITLLLVVAVSLTGCFGFLKKDLADEELTGIALTVKSEVVEPDESVTLTVIGVTAKGNKVIEPEKEAWTLVTEAAGALQVNEKNTAEATFTANKDFEGTVKVKIQFEDFEDEVEFDVANIIATGARAYADLVAQGPGDYAQNYSNASNSDDHNGVKGMPGNRGYAEDTAFTHWNWPGHWLEYKLDNVEAGEYALVIRYATNQLLPYTQRTLKVNDEVIFGNDNPIQLEDTGGNGNSPEEWGFHVVPGISIKETGDVSIILTHAGPEGERKGTNMAWIALVSPQNVTVDSKMIIKLEDAIGIERVEDFWK